MSFDWLVTGTVFYYPYLWNEEAKRGETEGRKSRPTVVGFRIRKKLSADTVLLFPLTTKQPEEGRLAVEIPEIEKQRAGLDIDVRVWVILDQYNQDRVGESFYLEPDDPIGHFSRAFFIPLLEKVMSMRERIKGVNRSSEDP